VTLTIHPVPGIKEISPGDDLPSVLTAAIAAAGLGPEPLGHEHVVGAAESAAPDMRAVLHAALDTFPSACGISV